MRVHRLVAIIVEAEDAAAVGWYAAGPANDAVLAVGAARTGRGIVPGITIAAGDAEALDIVAEIVRAVGEQRLAAGLDVEMIVTDRAERRSAQGGRSQQGGAQRVIQFEISAGDPVQLVVERLALELQFFGVLHRIVAPLLLVAGNA